jgi:ribose-phosphate pyrophosphokinase
MDDEIATGGTILEVLHHLRARKVGRVAIACTHGIFTGPAIDRLRAALEIAEIVTTNTVPLHPEQRLPNMHTLSIAPLLAEAIRRIHDGESVSSLFAEGA